MPIIKTTFLLLLLSLSFTSKAQYNEAMCILLKQQMHEYRFNTSNKNYRSAARNYEKNCKNPTPVNNAAAFEKLEQQTKEVAPVNSTAAANPRVHSGAIQAEPEETTAPIAEQTVEPIEQQMPAIEPEVQEPEPAEQTSASAEQTEIPAKVDRITISDAPKEPVVESTTSSAIQDQTTEIKTQSVEAATAEKPAEPEVKAEPAPKPAPTPAPMPEPIPANSDSSSSSLLMPSLIVLLVLLVAGLVIVRIRQSKKADADLELEQSLMQAKAIKAAAEAQAAAEKEADELKAATAAVLAEEQEHPHEDSYPLANDTFTATETDNNDEFSELMHFSAQRDKEEQESETSPEQPPAEDFADAHQFEDLELGYDEKNANDADDDFLDEQRELEQELKLASLEDSSYSINEEAEPQAEEVEQDEPELEEPSYTASSSFGFDEYSTKEPIEDEPLTPEPFADTDNNEPEKPELEEPSFTSSSSFGFDEYSTKEPIADDEPVLAEIEELEKPELDEFEKPEIVELEQPEIEEPSFTASSSFGFDEYSTKEPIADDEPVLAEIEELAKPDIDELDKPDIDKLEKPEIEELSFTSSSSFGFDEYTTKEPIAEDEPSKDEVPEYDLSSLMGDDLSFADHFNEDEHTVTAPSTTDEHDDISDDDLAKALQALEQELQDEPASVNVEEPSLPAVETVDLSDELSEDDKLEEIDSDSDNDADKEPEQQDDKPYNPFANLSLDPSWDPNSDEKPVIESKTKQPKSQALIDAEERAKQFKTDE
ncbi:hypothetical protein MKZ42_00840 [Pseudoalteromonas shioyasakiensis]|uniref:Cell surface protein n=1 Tax=Pseudoalteromonas shioyasakiensis TaxID=1190813 RepID=A0ABT6U567_9GAMM|nr:MULTISPECIES: hypothetical protein [Pseudoalteromonas]MDI4670806.1 hypothetical protein [Pseudoalteromonas shioyasakiensis]MDI4671813.1 hypothetical protein [Pseudoalteromonas shioyasakiensis]MDI4687662.1 hypothetical protein [Pseudoalteromonas shioyasakiensis]MDI4706311.1 hypothetical protein [Pseudoalteromonas shioyasakiensis]NUJ22851.1 hypothetical protein [Pseudoalteromonas sp. 0802]